MFFVQYVLDIDFEDGGVLSFSGRSHQKLAAYENVDFFEEAGIEQVG